MDIYPETATETAFSITMCLFGAIMWAFVVAAATSLLAGMDQSVQKARNEAETMKHFMRFRRVPRRLQQMVIEYQQCARPLTLSTPHALHTVTVHRRALRYLAATARNAQRLCGGSL
jgi:hypothetical protein